jgi:hypothetical protein
MGDTMGPVTLSQIEKAFENLGGEAAWIDAFNELHRLRGGDSSYYRNWMNYRTTAFQKVQEHCPVYKKFKGPTRFEWMSPGRFRLVESPQTPHAIDLDTPSKSERVLQETYRVLRDTKLTRSVKEAANYECEVCGETLVLGDGSLYAEAHHLQPLGSPHDGPDVRENIICVCPNHHALLDYAAIRLDKDSLPQAGIEFVEYHNRLANSSLRSGSSR